MAQAGMMLHCGAKEVSREELNAVPCPPPEGRWRPVPHGQVLDFAEKALTDAGYGVQKMRLGLARDNQRFWGTIVLESNIVQGVSLACAVASSLDRSTSLRYGYGHNVWICDNGAWRMERTIAKKHTTHSVDRYFEAICRCVADLPEFAALEGARIQRLQHRLVTDDAALSFLLKAYQDEGILSPRTLPIALKEWRSPSFEEFEPRTAWSLFNSITFALADRRISAPATHASLTIRLGALLASEPQLQIPA
jgi:hypothetical protein